MTIWLLGNFRKKKNFHTIDVGDFAMLDFLLTFFRIVVEPVKQFDSTVQGG